MSDVPNDQLLQEQKNEKKRIEKYRRDAENNYIDELHKLIVAVDPDFGYGKGKTDKCMVLKEAVRQIKLKRERIGDRTSIDLREGGKIDDNILKAEALGPLYLETLDAFIFLLDQNGVIDFASSNVDSFLGCKKNELIGKSVFNFVHLDDQTPFRECLARLSPTSPSSFLHGAWNNSNEDETCSSTLDMAGVGAATACLSINNECASTSSGFVNLHHQRRQLYREQFDARFILRKRRKSQNTAEDEGGGGGGENVNDSNALESSNRAIVGSATARIDPSSTSGQSINNTDRSLISSSGLSSPDFDPFSDQPSQQLTPSTPPPPQSASNSLVNSNTDETLDCKSLQVTATMCMLPKVVDSAPVSDITEPTLVCFIRRIPDMDKILIDQFSMRLDPNGMIISLDFTNFADSYMKWFNKQLMGCTWTSLCCPNDLPTLNKHFEEVMTSEGVVTSPFYRLKFSSDKYFYVMTRSRRMGSGETMCITCSHSIIRNSKTGERLYLESQANVTPNHITNNASIEPAVSTHCVVSTSECSSVVQRLQQPGSLSSMSVISSSLSTNESEVPTSDSSFLHDNSSDQAMDTLVDASQRPSMHSELISTSESLNTMSDNNIFSSSLSPNAQTNVPEYNLNESLVLNEIPFPSSSWPDYDTSTSSMGSNQPVVTASISNSYMIGSVNKSDANQTSSGLLTKSPSEDNKSLKTQKLRNLLTQKSDPGSPRNVDELIQSSSEGLLNFEINSCSSVLTPRPLTSPGDKRSVSPSSGQTEKGRSNDILRELLHQEDEEEQMFRPDGKADSMPGSFTFDPLANIENASIGGQSGNICTSSSSSSQLACMTMGSSQSCGSAVTSGTSCPGTTGIGFSSNNSASINSKSNGTERNNMLRKLLNDDDGGKSFRKSQDLLSDHLLKENQSTFVGVGCDSVFESPKPSGQLKRKSTEDHFTNVNNSGNTTIVPSSNSTNIPPLGMNMGGNPTSNSNGGCQPIKRLSLSEPVKSSAPSPVQTRPSSFLTSNPSAVPSSPNMTSPVPSNGMLSGALRAGSQPLTNMMINQAPGNMYQSQQLAGQNPMLAQMLAQTPKSLPLPTISIPTSIVSQVPQERLPKNLEKKLIHTPITTNAGGHSAAGSVIGSSGQTTLTFGFAGGNTSSQPNHVSPSSMIQTSPIVVSSQLPMSGTTTFNLVTSVSGGNSSLPHQFLMTSGGQLQPVKSILVQTGPVQGGGPPAMDSSGQPIMSTQGSFLNKIFLPSTNAGQTTIVKSSPSMAGMTGPNQMMNNNGQPMMAVGPQSNNYYKPVLTNNIGVLGPSFLNDRLSNTSSPQRGLDNQNDPLLADILEQVCSMEQEMDLDTNGNELRTNVSGANQASQSQSNSTVSTNLLGQNSTEDPMLMEILEDLPEAVSSNKTGSSNTSISNTSATTAPDLNEKLKISAIQKQLMSLDYSPTNTLATGMPSGNSSSSHAQSMNNNNSTMSSGQRIHAVYGPPPAYPAAAAAAAAGQQSIVRQISPTLSNSNSPTAPTTLSLLTAAPYPTKVIEHRPQPSNGPMNVQMISQSPNQGMNSVGGYPGNGMMVQSGQQIFVNTPMGNVNPRMAKAIYLERHQQKMHLQQMQQKQRFMAQQQQQIAMTSSQHHDLPSYKPMNEVSLNNTVPPNVTLQMVPKQPVHQQQPGQPSPQSSGQHASMQGSSVGSPFDPPMSPRFKMMSNMTPHSPSPQPPQLINAQHSPGTQRSHSSASNPPGRGFSPSPSYTSPSPHLSNSSGGAGSGMHRTSSSPHPYSPASPASGILSQSTSSVAPMQQSSVASTGVGSPAAGSWSPHPPPMHRPNPNSANINTTPSMLGSISSQIPPNRMQQQNPMLNAQLSQGSLGFIPGAPNAPSNSNPNTPQPPNSPSPSLLGNVRFNPNSPVPPSSTANLPGQYPLSPGYHNMHSSVTSPMQQQQQQQQAVMSGYANTQRPGQTSRMPGPIRMNSNMMPVAQSASNVGNASYYQPNTGATSAASTVSGVMMQSNFNAGQTGYGSSEYVKQELRAMVGARTMQNNHMQSNTISGGIAPLSTVPQMRPGSAAAVSPLGSSMGGVGGVSSIGNSSQYNSSLTPEDFDAMGLGLEMSDQMNTNPDSPLFNFGELAGSPGMVSSTVSRNSLNRSDVTDNLAKNSTFVPTTNEITVVSVNQPTVVVSSDKRSQSLLQQLLSEPPS